MSMIMNRRQSFSFFFLLICVFAFTGCQNKEMKQQLDLNELQNEMRLRGEDWPTMDQVSSKDANAKEMFTYLADFSYDKVAEYFFMYSIDSDQAGYEVAVVRLKNEKDKEELIEALADHVEYRKRTFETYSPDQVAIMNGASIISNGQYVALFATKNNGELKSIFMK